MASSSSVSYAYIRLLQCLYIAQRVQIQFAGLWSSKKCGNLLYRGIKMRCELALMLIVPMVFDMLSQYGINQLRSADRHSYEAPSNLLLPCPDTTTAIMVQTYCNILKKYFCMIRYWESTVLQGCMNKGAAKHTQISILSCLLINISLKHHNHWTIVTKFRP